MSNIEKFEERKRAHIDLALEPHSQTLQCNVLDRVILEHDPITDCNFEDIRIATRRFNKDVDTPFVVSSMTAGHANAPLINRRLMEAASVAGWAMGVGSQRRELTDAQAHREWTDLRKQYPNITLFSNIGISQLITTPIADIQRLIDNIQAQALIIHCNPLQEALQPEGTPQFKGGLKALERITKHLQIPVILKETGCGFSQSSIQRILPIPIAALDVSGLGGTHFGRIEGARYSKPSMQYEAAQHFSHWGIDTVQSILNALACNPSFEIWGSGGVRHGLDAARLLALGAQSIGFAKTVLEPALISPEAVFERMQTIMYELKIAMFCTNSKDIAGLRGKYAFQTTKI